VIYTDSLDLSQYCYDEQRRSLFITIANLGYVDYALNFIESLKRLGLERYLVVFALDAEAYDALREKTAGTGVGVVRDPNSDDIRELLQFRQGRWHRLTLYKIEVVHRLLRRGHDVLYSDSDIVLLRDPLAYLQDRLSRADIVIQDDNANLSPAGSPATTILCTGFFCVKSNAKTIAAFDPRHMRLRKLQASLRRRLLPRSKVAISDQTHFNSFIKHRLDVSVLPRDLFPNGYYYYESGADFSDAYLIHFNHIVGDKKRERMQEHGYFFLETV
jgi:hypothetical protein